MVELNRRGMRALRRQLRAALRNPSLSAAELSSWAADVEHGGGRCEIPAAMAWQGAPVEVRISDDGLRCVGTYDELELYVVAGGAATAVRDPVDTDGVEAILVAATCPDGALRAARAYDAGRATYGNLPWDGRTLSVVTLRDAHGYA